MNEIYNNRILELAGNIPRLGKLASPTHTASAHSKLCGSTISVELIVENSVVTNYAHDVKACALGQAAASIMARNIIGANAQELRDVRHNVYAMLKENAAPMTGKWEDIRVLEPVREYKARHASTLLAFDAVVKALDDSGV